MDEDSKPLYTALIVDAGGTRYAGDFRGSTTMAGLLAELTQPGMQLIITRTV